MTKLIKLSDTHYIILDDSDIKEGDFVYDLKDKVIRYVLKYLKDDWIKKITHSTEPLEYTNEDHLHWDKIKRLSLSEVEETINGYSVERLFEKEAKSWSFGEHGSTSPKKWFIEGFKAHQELVKDKLFTIEDMQLLAAELIGRYKLGEIKEVEDVQKIINSRLPKTEWDIEFDEQGKIKLI